MLIMQEVTVVVNAVSEAPSGNNEVEQSPLQSLLGLKNIKTVAVFLCNELPFIILVLHRRLDLEKL